jgi:hypothetical protein
MPEELAARSFSLCAHMCLPCNIGVLNETHHGHRPGCRSLGALAALSRLPERHPFRFSLPALGRIRPPLPPPQSTPAPAHDASGVSYQASASEQLLSLTDYSCPATSSLLYLYMFAGPFCHHSRARKAKSKLNFLRPDGRSRGRHTPLPACSRPGFSGYAGDNTRQCCSVCKQQGTTHCLLPACSRPGFSGYAGDNTRQWCCVCKELENNGQFLWTPVSGGKLVQALDSFVALS